MIDKFKIRESEKELSNIYREKKTWKDYDESIEERVHIWCTCQVQQPDKFYIYFSIQIKYYVTLQLKNISIIYYKKIKHGQENLSSERKLRDYYLPFFFNYILPIKIFYT